MNTCPTVKVKADTPTGYMIINESDFDPDMHEIVEDVPVEAATDPDPDAANSAAGEGQAVKDPAGSMDPSANPAAALSDDDLRAAITQMSGDTPHHRTGRDKLIETYNALMSGPTAGAATEGGGQPA